MDNTCFKFAASLGASTDNNEVFNNIFINCNRKSGSGQASMEFAASGGKTIDSNEIHHNTFIANGTGLPEIHTNCSGTCSNNLIKNNIFYYDGFKRMVNWTDSNSTNEFNGNLIWNTQLGHSRLVTWLGQDYSCADINNGLISVSQVQLNQCADPQFQDISTNDVHLASNSPAIDVADSVSGSTRTTSIANTIAHVVLASFPNYSDAFTQRGSGWDIGPVEQGISAITPDNYTDIGGGCAVTVGAVQTPQVGHCWVRGPDGQSAFPCDTDADCVGTGLEICSTYIGGNACTTSEQANNQCADEGDPSLECDAFAQCTTNPRPNPCWGPCVRSPSGPHIYNGSIGGGFGSFAVIAESTRSTGPACSGFQTTIADLQDALCYQLDGFYRATGRCDTTTATRCTATSECPATETCEIPATMDLHVSCSGGTCDTTEFTATTTGIETSPCLLNTPTEAFVAFPSCVFSPATTSATIDLVTTDPAPAVGQADYWIDALSVKVVACP
jgi:hypothetical protein